jgi:hypothetical protein
MLSAVPTKTRFFSAKVVSYPFRALTGGGSMRNHGVYIIIGLLAPTSVISQFPSMVTPENYDRVFRKSCFVEGLHQFAATGIYMATQA